MEQLTLYRPFELHVSDLDSWDRRPLIYHFFEIVRIIEGEGTRIVNFNEFAYGKGSIFLFTPMDCRGFSSKTPTRFCSIRFSETFLEKTRNEQERVRIAQWLKQLEHIFFHHNRFQELIFKQPGDCHLIASLVDNLIQEYQGEQAYREENLQHMVTLMLNILARNIAEGKGVPEEEEPLINRILLHLRQHMHEPDMLRVEYLASKFNISANYVGEYFRKAAGESLQHYITQYKIALVRQRLANSQLTVSQIADELGFTDESHLSRQFRKYNGSSPQEYRKQAREAAGQATAPVSLPSK